MCMYDVHVIKTGKKKKQKKNSHQKVFVLLKDIQNLTVMWIKTISFADISITGGIT